MHAFQFCSQEALWRLRRDYGNDLKAIPARYVQEAYVSKGWPAAQTGCRLGIDAQMRRFRSME